MNRVFIMVFLSLLAGCGKSNNDRKLDVELDSGLPFLVDSCGFDGTSWECIVVNKTDDRIELIDYEYSNFSAEGVLVDSGRLSGHIEPHGKTKVFIGGAPDGGIKARIKRKW